MDEEYYSDEDEGEGEGDDDDEEEEMDVEAMEEEARGAAAELSARLARELRIGEWLYPVNFLRKSPGRGVKAVSPCENVMLSQPSA